MAIALDHSTPVNLVGTGDSNVTTSSTGNLSVVAVNFRSSGQVITSVTDNKSNAYVSVGVSGSDGSITSEIWYAKNAATGITSVVVNFTGGGACDLVIYDCSGADTTTGLDDKAAVTDSASTTNPLGPTVTASASGGIVVSTVIAGTSVTAVASPFTLDSNANGNGIAHVLNSSSGTQTASWTESPSGSWGGTAAAFKAPAGGETVTLDKWYRPLSERLREKDEVVSY